MARGYFTAARAVWGAHRTRRGRRSCPRYACAVAAYPRPHMISAAFVPGLCVPRPLNLKAPLLCAGARPFNLAQARWQAAQLAGRAAYGPQALPCRLHGGDGVAGDGADSQGVAVCITDRKLDLLYVSSYVFARIFYGINAPARAGAGARSKVFSLLIILKKPVFFSRPLYQKEP